MTDYASLAEFKSFLNVDAGDNTQDAELGFSLSAASSAVDRATNRTFGVVSGAESRLYTAHYDRDIGRYVISIDDLMNDTGLVVAYDIDNDGSFSQQITDTITLLPLNADKYGRPWTSISTTESISTALGRVEVTALFGWTAIPTSVKYATLLQASRFFKRRDAPFGVAGSPEFGNELRLLERLDPDVMVMLQDYKKWWGSA